MEIVATYNPRAQCGQYRRKDWHERDTFQTQEAAQAYAAMLARHHTVTPYRIIRLPRRSYAYAVEYVPAHLLRH